MAENQAYKLKADTSIPRAIRQIDELIDGEKVYETEGRNYAAGSYVLASDMNPRDRERAENGELDHLLESVSLDEAQQGIAVQERGVFIADHEAEAQVLQMYGHEVVPRDQVLELKSAGADAAKDALEAAKEGGADERPNLTAREVPALAEVSRGEAENVPADSEHVAEEKLVDVEQPPGLSVGQDKALAEGEDQPRPKRARPQAKKQQSKSEQK